MRGLRKALVRAALPIVAARLNSLAALLALAGCTQTVVSGTQKVGSGIGSTGGASGSSSTGANSTGTGTTGARSGTGSGTGTASGAGTTGSAGGALPDAGACGGTSSSLFDTAVYLKSSGYNGCSNSADLNGDGLLDVVVGAGVGHPTFAVLFGLPDGGMESQGVYSVPEAAEAGPIAVADVTGDGLPDVLFNGSSGYTGPGEIDALINTGRGGILGPTTSLVRTPGRYILGIAVGDLDDDGKADVVDVEYSLSASSYELNAYLGLGDNLFSAAIPVPVAFAGGGGNLVSPAALFLVDFNQDGFPDIGVVPSGLSQLAVLLHRADGGYEDAIYSFPSPIGAVALPRKGAAPDIVVGYAGSSGTDGIVQILRNAGDGTFSKGPTYSVPNGAVWFAVSDFNGDCVPDVAIAGYGCGPCQGASVLFGDMDGGFGAAESLPTGAVGGLTLLGQASSPRALAAAIICGGDALQVYGDASRH